jgi:hypothetical protein
MKKMFISVIALGMGVMAMATESAYVQIKLTGENGGANKVFLTEDDAYTNAFEPGADVEKMMSQSNSKSVLMYGFVGSTPCEDVVASDLEGLVLGFKTNMLDANYKLTFSDVSGKALKLLDRVTNELVDIVNNGEYAFSVEAAQVGRVAVDDRFVIGGTPIVSFCFNYNVLEVMGHKGESLIVKQGDTEIANVASLPAAYQLDLSAQSGRLVVTLNGQDYQIDANPAVTPAN